MGLGTAVDDEDAVAVAVDGVDGGVVPEVAGGDVNDEAGGVVRLKVGGAVATLALISFLIASKSAKS